MVSSCGSRAVVVTASEVAISRLYAGVHYRSANENGLAQGKCVAEQVARLRDTLGPTLIWNRVESRRFT